MQTVQDGPILHRHVTDSTSMLGDDRATCAANRIGQTGGNKQRSFPSHQAGASTASKQPQQDSSCLTESKRCCSALKSSSCTGRSCNPTQMMVFATQPVSSHIALDFWSLPLVFLLPSRLPCCPMIVHARSAKGRQECSLGETKVKPIPKCHIASVTQRAKHDNVFRGHVPRCIFITDLSKALCWSTEARPSRAIFIFPVVEKITLT